MAQCPLLLLCCLRSWLLNPTNLLLHEFLLLLLLYLVVLVYVLRLYVVVVVLGAVLVLEVALLGR